MRTHQRCKRLGCHAGCQRLRACTYQGSLVCRKPCTRRCKLDRSKYRPASNSSRSRSRPQRPCSFVLAYSFRRRLNRRCLGSDQSGRLGSAPERKHGWRCRSGKFPCNRRSCSRRPDRCRRSRLMWCTVSGSADTCQARPCWSGECPGQRPRACLRACLLILAASRLERPATAHLPEGQALSGHRREGSRASPPHPDRPEEDPSRQDQERYQRVKARRPGRVPKYRRPAHHHRSPARQWYRARPPLPAVRRHLRSHACAPGRQAWREGRSPWEEMQFWCSSVVSSYDAPGAGLSRADKTNLDAATFRTSSQGNGHVSRFHMRATIGCTTGWPARSQEKRIGDGSRRTGPMSLLRRGEVV